MAIIVDKVQKREDIALACVELFSQRGIKKLTISEVAKSAGVGKGTIYEYFVNKEDIVFEIINVLMRKHNEQKSQKLLSVSSTQEKLKLFFDFFYSKEDEHLRKIYKEFLSISLAEHNEQMIAFQTKCFHTYYAWAQEIIQDGILRKEISSKASLLIKGLFAFGEGLFVQSISTTAVESLEDEINGFIDTLFLLLESECNNGRDI